MKISDAGLDLICKFEGFSPTVYKDIAGHDTIGFGHMVKAGEHFGTITQDEALNLLAADALKAERAVNELVKIKLDQDQFDALCSFTYNVGIENFKESTLLKLVNEDKLLAASAEFLRWDHVGGRESQGLLKRRNTESFLFRRV